MTHIAAILVAFWGLFATPLLESEPITVSQTSITNEYPEAATFEIEAASSAGTIESVELNLKIRGSGSTAMEPAEFEPGQQVVARYVWKTRYESIPPGTPIQYTWTVRDDAGNKLTTEAEDYVVTDSRFTWQTLENDDIALWWYAGDGEFGQGIFESAAQALDAMKENTGQSLPHRIHVVLYGNDEDFDSWHNYAREWVGGEAFPATGLTVQIVPARNSQRIQRWIQQVIPHEIAHLFFFQNTVTPFAAGPPTWLNEGFAQYHELGPRDDELAWVQSTAERGELIPLRLLSGTFTGDDERISLSYAESLSAVTFLLERWGDVGMGELLSAYKAGDSTDEALLAATGLDLAGFELAWWEWLGGEPGMYPTRRAQAAVPTMPPFQTPTLRTTPLPTERPEATPAPAALSTAAPVPSEPPTATPNPTEPPAVSPTPNRAERAGSSCCLPCPGALGFLGMGMAAALVWRRSGSAGGNPE